MVSLFPWIGAAGLLLAVAPVPVAQGGPGRLRPPEGVTCPRNDLTVYAGRVTTLERRTGETSLTIATDWQTTERVTIRHPGTTDPDAWLLIKGKPFTPETWSVIAPKGTLRDGVRANAWVCRDGRNAIIDFTPPPGPGYLP